ncbi:DUF934 domain-containing protein (plasmid) [Pseudorhodobacter turbinis]|uniref:DUF934 domain-containing protein n=1 Tax=Pseudorhodobacter turbinis TaxID=2500533 RepID=A0A4P8EL54_9RHOB|nr:DUF934 domain-containing protein [Pseudorhodobacter turbinis]QCO57788.1 DUF934 domain-containing protein [Pseudorhodobacter turbinis]
MSVLIRDNGFSAEDWENGFTDNPQTNSGDSGPGLDLAADADLSVLQGRLDDFGLIRVDFASFADGRGFTLARQLRRMGYTKRLRARGPLIADQYAMARRSGFDEVEIPKEQAERQPEQSWLFRADWQANDYQSRLRG